MNGILIGAVRTAVQSLWGQVVVWLAAAGVSLTDEQSTAAVVLLTSVGIGLGTAGIRWLETREGDDWQVWARRAGAWLMLGLSGSQPLYPGHLPVELDESETSR